MTATTASFTSLVRSNEGDLVLGVGFPCGWSLPVVRMGPSEELQDARRATVQHSQVQSLMGPQPQCFPLVSAP